MAKNRIKELRNSANPKITLKELSDKLKDNWLSFTDSQLSYYENGTRSPRNEAIWGALAEIFDVDKLYLMGFRDKKTPGNLRVSLEHTEKEKNLLIELKGQMLELKKVILNAEITIENIEKKLISLYPHLKLNMKSCQYTVSQCLPIVLLYLLIIEVLYLKN